MQAIRFPARCGHTVSEVATPGGTKEPLPHSCDAAAKMLRHQDIYPPLMEEALNAITDFRRPLVVYVGLGFPRQIADAEEAFILLNEMPSAMHGPSHSAARNACRAAMNGEIDAETARGVVEAFARARGILAQEAVAEFAMETRHDLLGT